MTPQEINIAIAEACGWVAITSDVVGIPPGSRGTADARLIPNYHGDLNTRDEMLGNIIESGKMKQFSNRFAGIWDALSIPQPEFCERFLRTIGKWIDPQKLNT